MLVPLKPSLFPLLEPATFSELKLATLVTT